MHLANGRLLVMPFNNSLGLGCMRYYSIILEDLAFKHSLRIYCIDRPGVGMSQAADPEVYKVLTQSSFLILIAISAFLSLRKCYLCVDIANIPS